MNIAANSSSIGTYFCSKINDQWEIPVKIADAGDQPRVLVDKDGDAKWISKARNAIYSANLSRLFEYSVEGLADISRDRRNTRWELKRAFCIELPRTLRVSAEGR